MSELLLPSIMQSIKPQDCELIVSGKKTIESCRTKPNIPTPFKVYIYCTKNGFSIYGNNRSYVTDYESLLSEEAEKSFLETSGYFKWNGKVIGEYVCDDIVTSRTFSCDPLFNEMFCMSNNVKGELYGFHISNLKIYDKPKELREFYNLCYSGCKNCKIDLWQAVQSGKVSLGLLETNNHFSLSNYMDKKLNTLLGDSKNGKI